MTTSRARLAPLFELAYCALLNDARKRMLFFVPSVAHESVKRDLLKMFGSKSDIVVKAFALTEMPFPIMDLGVHLCPTCQYWTTAGIMKYHVACFTCRSHYYRHLATISDIKAGVLKRKIERFESISRKAHANQIDPKASFTEIESYVTWLQQFPSSYFRDWDSDFRSSSDGDDGEA